MEIFFVSVHKRRETVIIGDRLTPRGLIKLQRSGGVSSDNSRIFNPSAEGLLSSPASVRLSLCSHHTF